ncbi:MAG: major capsid protein [Clostridia bacterium]|nr:major capsid protein [Clostridia bacterium]
MPRSVLELFNQKEILNYLKERKFPAMMGEELFPEVKKQSLEFDMLTNNSKVPVIASVHGFDTESEIGQREAEKMAIELALIKRKMQLKEKEIIALESPRNDAERQYLMKNVYNDFDNLIASVRARVEKMRMDIIANGAITLDENGLSATIDYGVPAANKVTNVDWTSASANPINDILSWCNQLDRVPGRVITSKTILAKILKNANITSALFGNNTTRLATPGELNTYLESLGLPKIYTYDEKYRKLNANGTYTKYRYFPENKFVMIPSETLGETIYGPTAEEIRLQRDPSIDVKSVGKIFACMYEEGKDPVSTWEKAVATALPALTCAEDIFQATITLT